MYFYSLFNILYQWHMSLEFSLCTQAVGLSAKISPTSCYVFIWKSAYTFGLKLQQVWHPGYSSLPA